MNRLNCVTWIVALCPCIGLLGGCVEANPSYKPTSETTSNCSVGSEGCACTDGGSCDAALECLSSTCVHVPLKTVHVFDDDESLDGSADPNTTAADAELSAFDETGILLNESTGAMTASVDLDEPDSFYVSVGTKDDDDQVPVDSSDDSVGESVSTNEGSVSRPDDSNASPKTDEPTGQTDPVAQNCANHEECTNSNAPLCDSGECTSCRDAESALCSNRNPDYPACSDSGECLECILSGDCGGELGCVENECVECSDHTDCEYACHQRQSENRCVGRVAWVGASGCDDFGGGEKIKPFCRVEPAIEYLNRVGEGGVVGFIGDYRSELDLAISVRSDTALVFFSEHGATIEFQDRIKSAGGLLMFSGVNLQLSEKHPLEAQGDDAVLEIWDGNVSADDGVVGFVSDEAIMRVHSSFLDANYGFEILEDGELHLKNTAIRTQGHSIGVSDGVAILSYSTLVTTGSAPGNIVCSSSSRSRIDIRNSIVVDNSVGEPSGTSGVSRNCEDEDTLLVWHTAVSRDVDSEFESDTDGVRVVGTYESDWFEDPSEFDYHLTDKSDFLFEGLASYSGSWDPSDDIDGDSRPSVGYVGYDEPN